jgi:hypothetical protein
MIAGAAFTSRSGLRLLHEDGGGHGFITVFHYQEGRRNGTGPLGLHEHRADSRADSRGEQRDSRPELDGLLRVPANGRETVNNI